MRWQVLVCAVESKACGKDHLICFCARRAIQGMCSEQWRGYKWRILLSRFISERVVETDVGICLQLCIHLSIVGGCWISFLSFNSNSNNFFAFSFPLFLHLCPPYRTLKLLTSTPYLVPQCLGYSNPLSKACHISHKPCFWHKRSVCWASTALISTYLKDRNFICSAFSSCEITKGDLIFRSNRDGWILMSTVEYSEYVGSLACRMDIYLVSQRVVYVNGGVAGETYQNFLSSGRYRLGLWLFNENCCNLSKLCED